VCKLILGFLTFFILGTANAQTAIEPISNVVARIKNVNDTSEIGYIGMRCGSLYGSIAAYFEVNGNASDAQTIRELNRQGDAFKKVGIALNLGANKMSSDAITKQANAFITFYTKTMSEGKRLNNNAFTPFIQADLASCKIEADGFSQLAAKIK
jgi:hypothetical protein